MAALFESIFNTLSSSLFHKEAYHTVVNEEPVRESPEPSPNRKASSTMAGLQKGRKYRAHISGGTNLLIEWRDDEEKAALENFILPKSQSVDKHVRIKNTSSRSSTQLDISSKARNESEDTISKIQPCMSPISTPSDNVIPPYFNANITSPINTVIPLYVLSNTFTPTYLNVSPAKGRSNRKNFPHRIITLQTIFEDPLGEEEAGLRSPLDSGVILSDTDIDTDSDSARYSAIEPPKTPDPTAASLALHASARQAAYQAPKKPRRTNVRGTLFNTAPTTAAANGTNTVLSFSAGGESDMCGEGHYSLTKGLGESSGRVARRAKEADDVFAIDEDLNFDVGTDRTAVPRAVAADEGTLEENKENVDEDGSMVC